MVTTALRALSRSMGRKQHWRINLPTMGIFILEGLETKDICCFLSLFITMIGSRLERWLETNRYLVSAGSSSSPVTWIRSPQKKQMSSAVCSMWQT